MNHKTINALPNSAFHILIFPINKRKPLQPPINNMDEIWKDYEKAAVIQMMEYTFIGSAKTVQHGLQKFLHNTNVDEIMVASYIYDNDAKVHSYELIAPFFKTVIGRPLMDPVASYI